VPGTRALPSKIFSAKVFPIKILLDIYTDLFIPDNTPVVVRRGIIGIEPDMLL
jgi:hypothetical protein